MDPNLNTFAIKSIGFPGEIEDDGKLEDIDLEGFAVPGVGIHGLGLPGFGA